MQLSWSGLRSWSLHRGGAWKWPLCPPLPRCRSDREACKDTSQCLPTLKGGKAQTGTTAHLSLRSRGVRRTRRTRSLYLGLSTFPVKNLSDIFITDLMSLSNWANNLVSVNLLNLEAVLVWTERQACEPRRYQGAAAGLRPRLTGLLLPLLLGRHRRASRSNTPSARPCSMSSHPPCTWSLRGESKDLGVLSHAMKGGHISPEKSHYKKRNQLLHRWTRLFLQLRQPLVFLGFRFYENYSLQKGAAAFVVK